MESVVGAMEAAARAGGAVARRHFLRGVDVMLKADRSPVSVADREAEQAVVTALAAAFPDHGVLGEEGRPAGRRADPALPRARSQRGFGDFLGYAWLAAGRVDVALGLNLKIWDLAAPKVSVEEAGGRLTDLDGGDSLISGSALATSGLLHEAALGAFAPSQ